MVKLLIHNKVYLHEKSSNCHSSWLHEAIRGAGIQKGSNTKDKDDIVKLLLEAGLDYREKDCRGTNVYETGVGYHSRINSVFYPYMTQEERQYYKNKFGE
jgi:ankyrin repeat protein